MEHNFLQDFFEDKKYEFIKDRAYPKEKNVSNWINWFDIMTECIIRREYRMTHGGEIDTDLLSDIWLNLK